MRGGDRLRSEANLEPVCDPDRAPLPGERPGGICVLQGVFACCRRHGEPWRRRIPQSSASVGLQV